MEKREFEEKVIETKEMYGQFGVFFPFGVIYATDYKIIEDKAPYKALYLYMDGKLVGFMNLEDVIAVDI